MCGVRCTHNLAAYCNNGLHLTFRGEGVIFMLLHKFLSFLISLLPKLQLTLQRDNLQAPDYLLAIQIVLFTIANLPALYIAFFGVGRLLSYYFDPFGILYQ